MARRELMQAGYTLINGHVMSQYEIDRYNYIQGRINAFIDAGLPVSQSLLNESHSIIAAHLNN